MIKLYVFIAFAHLKAYKITVFAIDDETARAYRDRILKEFTLEYPKFTISSGAFSMSILEGFDILNEQHGRRGTRDYVHFSIFNQRGNEEYFLSETKDNLVGEDKLTNNPNRNVFFSNNEHVMQNNNEIKNNKLSKI